MMLYQLGDALLRNSMPNSSWARAGSLLTTSWTHASRNAESLIKLARQDHNGRVMGVLIISFGVWGIADIFRGSVNRRWPRSVTSRFRPSNSASSIPTSCSRSGASSPPLTMEQARAFGIDRQVLQQTIAEATLDEEARRLGLGQSDAETMRTIFSDPNFKGAGGKFDPVRFQTTLRQFGFSEQRYVADQRRVSLRRQIAGTISAGIEPRRS